MEKNKVETEVCVLCGSPDQDMKTDHLRECYKLAQGKLDRGQYHPHLYESEMDKLQRGGNPICSNMIKCRGRRSAFIKQKPSSATGEKKRK